MMDDNVILWLLEGDVAIQYQTRRDLLNRDDKELQERIADEGWGARYLSCQHEDGHWGMGFYQPKWTSTHYTLLDLRNLCLSPRHKKVQQAIVKVLQENRAKDGGINPARTLHKSDVCINGMFLNYACYFRTNEKDLHSVVDFILSQHMPDGGFNCHSNRKGAVHSSLHTTLSVMEGIQEYTRNGYMYRLSELTGAHKQSIEFILMHRLYKSHRTGEVIRPNFLTLSYPSRWYYDILRALDHFCDAGISYDSRMQDALDILVRKQRQDSRWPLQAKHPGKTHFEMEGGGQPSRWNTLRALRVLKHFKTGEFSRQSAAFVSKSL